MPASLSRESLREYHFLVHSPRMIDNAILSSHTHIHTRQRCPLLGGSGDDGDDNITRPHFVTHTHSFTSVNGTGCKTANKINLLLLCLTYLQIWVRMTRTGSNFSRSKFPPRNCYLFILLMYAPRGSRSGSNPLFHQQPHDPGNWKMLTLHLSRHLVKKRLTDWSMIE